MIRGIIELVDLLLLWGFWYVVSFLILVFGVVYITKSNPTPIIHQHYTTVEMLNNETPKKVFVEEEICTRIDGCRIIDNVCIDCVLKMAQNKSGISSTHK